MHMTNDNLNSQIQLAKSRLTQSQQDICNTSIARCRAIAESRALHQSILDKEVEKQTYESVRSELESIQLLTASLQEVSGSPLSFKMLTDCQRIKTFQSMPRPVSLFRTVSRHAPTTPQYEKRIQSSLAKGFHLKLDLHRKESELSALKMEREKMLSKGAQQVRSTLSNIDHLKHRLRELHSSIQELAV